MEKQYRDDTGLEINLLLTNDFMGRRKIYTEEFLVRATAEEMRWIDDLAKKARVSRSRMVVVSTLSGGQSPVAESFKSQESMIELRAMALMELRRARNKLERLTDLLQQTHSVTLCDGDLAESIKEVKETMHLLRDLWDCEPSRK